MQENREMGKLLILAERRLGHCFKKTVAVGSENIFDFQLNIIA